MRYNSKHHTGMRPARIPPTRPMSVVLHPGVYLIKKGIVVARHPRSLQSLAAALLLFLFSA